MQPASTLFVIMIMLFVTGICILFASYMNDQILTPISDKVSSTQAKTIFGNIDFVFSTLDQLFFFAAFGLGIVSVLLAYITPARSAFLFLSIILFAIALLIVPQFANMFQDISEKSQFTAYSSDYPMMLYIFQNYGLFFWVFGFLIIVVLFAKIRGGGSV